MVNTDEGYRECLKRRVPGKGHESDYPAPVQNYKESELYTDHQDDLNAWAWEFLRRNPRYQFLTDQVYIHGARDEKGSAYRHLDKEFYPWKSHWSQGTPDELFTEQAPRYQDLIRERHKAAAEEYKAAKDEEKKAKTPDKRDEFCELAEKHKKESQRYLEIAEIYDGPAKRHDDNLKNAVQSSLAPRTIFHAGLNINDAESVNQAKRSLVYALELQEERSGSSSKCMGFVFDLTLPIGTQLEKAERDMRAQQSQLGIVESKPLDKPSAGKKGVNWLRVLDGMADGAKPLEILKALGFKKDEGTSRLQDLKKAAIKRRDASPAKLLKLIGGK